MALGLSQVSKNTFLGSIRFSEMKFKYSAHFNVQFCMLTDEYKRKKIIRDLNGGRKYPKTFRLGSTCNRRSGHRHSSKTVVAYVELNFRTQITACKGLRFVDICTT